MKTRIAILFLAGFVLVSSCGTTKRVSYLQDIQSGVPMRVQDNGDLKIEPGDRLRITVFSQDKELTSLFNLSDPAGNNNFNQAERHPYTVRTDGTVEIPVLGPISVKGLTRMQVADEVKYGLLSSKLLLDPTVIVDYYDLGFSVIGEVNSPGRKVIPKDKLTILEALALAGDLTILGKRENVLVLRTENDIQTPYFVDLTNTDSVYSSPVYYIRQNDVIYVEPNPKKASQSDVNASTFRTIGFWLSLPATVVSIATLLIQVLK